jgi:hemin uptake protein HemP
MSSEESDSEFAVTRPSPRVIASEVLLAGQREVLILHGSEVYRLRQTQSGKLILQK